MTTYSAQKITRLTENGKLRFSAELDYLRNVKLKDLRKHLRSLYEEQYEEVDVLTTTTQLEMSIVESRIKSLEFLLSRSIVVDANSLRDIVEIGSSVEIQEIDGNKRSITIVSPEESDPRRGNVSIKSPLGKALMGKQAGDPVIVFAPSGDWKTKIIAVS